MGLFSQFWVPAERSRIDTVAPRHWEQPLSRSFFARLRGLLRGACHRARIRATRWLAMTISLAPSALLRLLAAHLHLAEALGPALAIVLRAALHGKRIVGHVFRDHRARADISAIADSDRRYQRRVG